ncbi:MAG: helix-turn-helix domain-containing protein [Candidatus Paceibacterota bacterium]|jgi:DNA-binding HxlR family transcriptional regulator
MKKTPEKCPIAKTALLLSDFRTILIVRDLLGGPKHFSEMERSLVTVSSRTLSLKLKRLVSKGIIKKDEAHYTITKVGRRLGKVIEAMGKCGESL